MVHWERLYWNVTHVVVEMCSSLDLYQQRVIPWLCCYADIPVHNRAHSRIWSGEKRVNINLGHGHINHDIIPQESCFVDACNPG